MTTTKSIPDAPTNPLPRELAPDLLWLGSCLEIAYRGSMLHSYTSSYVVSGTAASLLVDPGITHDPTILERQLEQALAGRPPLRYIFLSHQETPHAGGVGRLLTRYPDCVALGDVRDYHLYFPEHADRFRPLEVGESIDLGENEFTAVDAVIKDLNTTRWGYAARQRTLFCSDGYAYAHHHRAGQCGRTAEEVPALDIVELAGVFYQYALPWILLTDMERYVARLTALIDRLGAQIVAPVHGLPVTDIQSNLPITSEALLTASRRPSV